VSDARSVYEVDCTCGEKARLLSLTGTCSNCGREIRIESWQVQHTQTAEGLITRTSPSNPQPSTIQTKKKP
jgi:hypothetical protein